MQWNFYLSGILYGRFYEEEQEVFVSRRDAMSGHFLPGEPLSGEVDEYFVQLCKRSLWEFFCNKEEYEKIIEKGAEHGVTAFGEEFTKRRAEAYIQRNCKAAKDLFYEDGKIYALLMSARDYTAVLVRDGYEDKTVLSKWKEMYPEETANVSFAGTFFVDTRDGERLATDVYLPEKEGEKAGKKIPAVLVRTPYGKKKGVEIYYRFVQRGYALVVQDTRGREESTGKWQPNYYEVETIR